MSRWDQCEDNMRKQKVPDTPWCRISIEEIITVKKIIRHISTWIDYLLSKCLLPHDWKYNFLHYLGVLAPTECTASPMVLSGHPSKLSTLFPSFFFLCFLVEGWFFLNCDFCLIFSVLVSYFLFYQRPNFWIKKRARIFDSATYPFPQKLGVWLMTIILQECFLMVNTLFIYRSNNKYKKETNVHLGIYEDLTIISKT